MAWLVRLNVYSCRKSFFAVENKHFFLKFLVLICCYTSLYSVPILIIEQEDGTYPHLQQVASNLQKIGYLLSEINCMFTWESSQTEMLFFLYVCIYVYF